MENMGLITYRDSILNFTESSGLRQKAFCILVMAHESAHMWFGNQVTMVFRFFNIYFICFKFL